jgi:transcriptional regulator with XRE-family HTH domain
MEMITGAQIRMARGYLRWSAKELADKAGVAESTIKRMEQDEGFPIARGSNIEAVYKALISAGIALVPENGGGVGVRLAKPASAATRESKSAGDTETVHKSKTRRRPSKRHPKASR